MSEPVNRLTIVDKVYFQTSEETKQINGVSSRDLASFESELYSRKMKTNSEWKKIDTGFILDDCSLVIIENTGEVNIRVSFRGDKIPDCLISVGESLKFTPIKATAIQISSLENSRITVVSIPS